MNNFFMDDSNRFTIIIMVGYLKHMSATCSLTSYSKVSIEFVVDTGCIEEVCPCAAPTIHNG